MLVKLILISQLLFLSLTKARLVLKHGRLIVEEDEGGGDSNDLLSIEPLRATTNTPEKDFSLLTFQSVNDATKTTTTTTLQTTTETTTTTTTTASTTTTTIRPTQSTLPPVSQIAANRFKQTFAFLQHTPDANREFRVHFVEFPDGNYTGELNHLRQRNGWGEIYWREGTFYGPGQMFIYSKGDRYVGQWQNNLQHGN